MNIADIDKVKEALIGLTKQEASTICKSNGFTMRVTQKDDVNYIVTCDLRFDRINIELKNDLVVSCSVG